ncbi:MAG: c-type cytochrome domain-containing protein [Planctomycetota bacterium]
MAPASMPLISLQDAPLAYGLEQWLEFAGRLHPLVLHLPIGLLVAVALAELAAARRRELAPMRTLLHAVLGASAALAALTGWRLGLEAGHPASLLDDHRTLGIASACAASVTAAFALLGRSANAARARVGFLAVTGLLFAAAGHRGGMMTHGARFLSGAAPPWLAPLVGPEAPPPVDAPPVRERRGTVESPPGEPSELPTPALAEVADAFRASCVECHGPEKQKGGLRLDEASGWLSSVDLESPVDSELVYRITLPADDPDAMPPEGEPRVSDAHVAVLLDWIERGAPEDELRPGGD